MDASQVKPPLKLLRRHSVIPTDIREEPPSFCMEPYNMKLDLYDVEDEDVDLQDAVVRKAPVQSSVLMLHPAYDKSLSFIYDTKNHRIWTRSCTPSTEHGMWSHSQLLPNFQKFEYPVSARWLHCIRLSSLHPKNHVPFAVVVADIIHPEMPHYDRRTMLESIGLQQLGIKEMPEAHSVHLIPEFNEKIAPDLWAAMHLQNQEWNQPFFTGIICKEADGKYLIQKEESYKSDLVWQFHEFDSPF